MVPRGLIFGVLGVLIFAVAAATAALSVQRYTPYRHTRIGGPFTMEDTRGRTVTEADLRGRPTAVFFGYTSCPDICPTTLSNLTDALARLGPAADRLTVMFVTVDPERDTPARLRDYLSSFDPRIRGLTGTQGQVDAMADAYHVYRRRRPGADGDYTMDHTATVFLIDDTGQLAGEINQGESEDRVAAKLAALAEPDRTLPDEPARTDLWADTVRLARRWCGL